MSTPPPLIGYDFATAPTWRARLRYWWRDVGRPALGAVWRGELSLGQALARLAGR